MLVDGLSSDLKLDVVHEGKANVLGPLGVGDGGQGNLQVDAVDEVTVAADLAGHALSEVGRSVNGCTPPFGVFIGYSPGPRLYLKP